MFDGGIAIMKITTSAIFVGLLTTGASAEIVTTSDGRRIDLKSDGTYVIVGEAKASPISMDKKTPFFEPFSDEYGQNSMRFMPIFSNATGKTVVGFKFRAEFKSPFGEEVFAFDGESSERIGPGKDSTSDTFYFFKDNQFINGEPFDKLSVFHATGTGKISTTLLAVVFDDGEVIRLED